MHIAMDGREALNEKRTGKGQWAHGFMQELQKRDVRLTSLVYSHLYTIKTLLRLKPDLYVSPTSYIVPALIGKWISCAIVVHDLIAFQNEPHDFKAMWIERLTLRWALKYSKWVFTVSKATKRDLLERFPWVEPAKVRVIYAGPSLTGNTKSEVRNPKQRTTILCIGTLCPRKNQLRLIEAFEHLPRRGRIKEGGLELALAGARGWHDDEIVQKAKKTPNVTWLGHVSDDQYRELLESATIFALPSLYEGFGLAVLDAMIMGIPVLTSARGSLKEIAGDAALYIDPENIDSITEGLKRLLKDENLRSDLAEKGLRQAQKFSWERTVDLFLQFIQ
ncbi:glycosyltransferase family 4 protein [Candidatus Peregrinibacteria bacterium]|nr:glycosyltransferase family 4 protein [Candidatus Peregrinibacteria bacterium]